MKQNINDFERLPQPAFYQYYYEEESDAITTSVSIPQSPTTSSTTSSSQILTTIMTSIANEITTPTVQDTTGAEFEDIAFSSAASEAAPTWLTLALVVLLLVLFILSEADVFGKRRQLQRQVVGQLGRVQALVTRWEAQNDDRERILEEEKESGELNEALTTEMRDCLRLFQENRDAHEASQDAVLNRLDRVENSISNLTDMMVNHEEEAARKEEEELRVSS